MFGRAGPCASGDGGAGNEPASVVIVFDGSSSMWGNIDGDAGSKLAVAREAVRRALGKVGPQTRVGLAPSAIAAAIAPTWR